MLLESILVIKSIIEYGLSHMLTKTVERKLCLIA